MSGAFPDVLWVVCGLGMLAALLAASGSSARWEAYTKRGLFMESAQPNRHAPVSLNSREAERAEEVRQLVEAANHRRVRRGESPRDVDAEVARLISAEAGAGRGPQSSG